jgi:signal transduction histidine kinase
VLVDDAGAQVVAGHNSMVAVSTTAVPVRVEGDVRAWLVVRSPGGPLPAEAEAQLTHFAELAALAFAGAEAKANLIASRARIVAATDEARRRLLRDVHDGAQQRLVHAVIALKQGRNAVEPGSAAAVLVEEALASVEGASSALRDLVHGILPRSLIYGGLRLGLESLVADLSLPVEVRINTPRLPASIETTAYLVVAEAVTNAVTHARAQKVDVHVELEGERLDVEVSDDGVGGADPGRGTGLTGLIDRVDVAGGSLRIASRPGEGTTVRASLPVRSGLARGAAARSADDGLSADAVMARP